MVSIKTVRAGGGSLMMMGRRTVWIRRVIGGQVYSWWEDDLGHLFVNTLLVVYNGHISILQCCRSIPGYARSIRRYIISKCVSFFLFLSFFPFLLIGQFRV